MNSSYKIRSARFEELPLLSHIENSAAALFLDTPYAFLVNDDPLSLDFVQQQFQAGRVWVATDRYEIIVGYAIAREVDNTLYLQQIDVEPEHGRRGIGSALINTVCAWAKQQGYSIVSLSTFRNIPWNAPFYSKLGFRPLDEAELTTGFQQIRIKELAAGLPISERVVMYCEFQPLNSEVNNGGNSMTKIALLIQHKTQPGKRDEVHQIWERYMQPNIAKNPGHEAYFYCFDNDDPDRICAFQQYTSLEASQDFLKTDSYAAYLKEVETLIAEPPQFTWVTPVWVKGE